MKHPFKYCILFLLLFLLGGSSMQADDDNNPYNPTNPPEPNPTYRVSVKATPADKASASGTGRYTKGQSVYINASAKDTDYEFKYWTKDGVQISEGRSFYYTVTETDVEFEAVYELKEFNPTNPSDPNMDYKYRLYVTANPEEACSFNVNNGERHSAEEWVTVTAYPSQGFIFQGWFDQSSGNKVSDEISFNYEMPADNARLEARFKYNPSSPADPSSVGSQTDIDTGKRGDINGDGTVDVTDATLIINQFLSSAAYDARYDMNGDKTIDVTDATIVINIYLGK